MLDQVEQIARREDASQVTSITIRIGPLSGVVTDLLRQAFPLASAGTVAQDARLICEKAGVRVICSQCGAETEALPNRMLCGECGDYRTRLIAGDELLLVSVELTTDPTPAASIDGTFSSSLGSG